MQAAHRQGLHLLLLRLRHRGAQRAGHHPVPRTTSPAGADRPRDRTGGMETRPTHPRQMRRRRGASTHTASDGTEHRPYASQTKSLYSSNTMSLVEEVPKRVIARRLKLDDQTVRPADTWERGVSPLAADQVGPRLPARQPGPQRDHTATLTEDKHTARLRVGVHGTLSSDRHALLGTIPLLGAGKNVELTPERCWIWGGVARTAADNAAHAAIAGHQNLSVRAVTSGES